jgi:hypothetical protein
MMPCAANLAEANLGPLRYGANVLDAMAAPAWVLTTVFSMSCGAGVEARRLHVDLLRALLDEAAAGVGVVVGDLLLDLANAEAVGDEFVGVELDLVFAVGPPKLATSTTPLTLLKVFSSDQSSSDFFSMAS